MVAHQAIGVDLPPGLLAGLGEGLEEIVPIHVVQVDLLAAIATAHDMVHRPGILDAHLTRHLATLAKGTVECQETCSDGRLRSRGSTPFAVKVRAGLSSC